MNFGEALAYWYLRFNGFFPLSNFVLHRGAEGLAASADSDLLAVRFRHAYEEIGGQPSDWDRATFGAWGVDLDRGPVALIVEVKTGAPGRELRDGIRRAFSYERLLYAVRRLGMFPLAHSADVAEHLTQVPVFHDPETGLSVASLLITAHAPGRGLPPALTMKLEDADRFIRARLHAYLDPKREARMFFPSELVQYLIWSTDRDARNILL